MGRKEMGAAGAVLAVLATPAPAQDDRWAEQVQALIGVAAESFAEGGYHYGGFSKTGALRAGGTETLTVRLGSNVHTMVVGVCDTDCSDMDLVLLDASGRQVDSDVTDDDVPIVSVSPPRDGTYTLEVRMIDCDSSPCRYGVQQFVK